MNLEVLNDENINSAIEMQKEIFPLENGSEDLKEALNNICQNKGVWYYDKEIFKYIYVYRFINAKLYIYYTSKC